MRYKELKEADPRLTQMQSSREQIAEILEYECSDFYNLYKTTGRGFYRGANLDVEFGVIRPKSAGPRKPIGFTSGNLPFDYYKDLFNKLPSWKVWPDRTRSIIGSTSDHPRHGAARYTRGSGGNVYQVFPINNSLIGLCPAFDWWLSFEQGLDLIDDMFNVRFDQIGDLVKSDLYHDQLDGNWELIDEFLNPIDNKFEIFRTPAVSVHITDNAPREIWTDGDSYIVEQNLIKEIVNGQV